MTVTKPLTPTLKELRSSSNKAWLWDSERARIVWANGPGIGFFEGQSLFDLIDRPFDPNEPGVESIRAAAARLADGESVSAELVFPSAGQSDPVTCRCLPYKLSDGRPGVLAVEIEAEAVRAAADESGLQQAFKLLPSAMVFIAQNGLITSRNDAALELLPGEAGDRFVELLPMGKLATALQRLAATTVVTVTGRLAGRYGEREVKVTLRKLPEGGGAFAFAVFEDITERRLLEAQVPENQQAWTNAAPAPQEAGKALEQLAQSIKQEMAAAKPANSRLSAPAKTRPPENEVLRDGGRQQTIPDTIKQAMERSGEAVLIAQKGRAVFATEKAAALFGFESGEAFTASPEIPSQLNGLTDSKVELRLPQRNGELINVTIISTHIPWLHGAARQFRIRPSNGQALRNGQDKSVETAAVQRPVPEPESDTSPGGLAVGITAAETARKTAGASTSARKIQATANDELRAILDVVSDGIITLDDKGRILSFSAGAQSIFGKTLGDVIGLPLAQLLHEDSRNVLRDYLSALNGPGLASVFNDGREIIAKVEPHGVTPLFLTLGRLQGQATDATYCAVVRDITQWKRTERELRDAKNLAESSARQKSEFMARMGHELRTPITAILGFADIMRQDGTVEWRRDRFAGYANDIHASGTHLLSLINDLLDLSKVEAGKMELEFTEVKLKDPVGDAVRMVGEQAAQAGVVVRTAIPERLPKVVGDLRALRQILLNLLSNAVKFTDQGGEVIVSAALDDAGNMHLKVRDTGIGMTPHEVEAALEPFKRIRTDGRETPGTGLGLPLTRALVEANRARFDISSEKGKGTTVDMVFPTNRVLSE